jgi:uncharacterized protein (DUF885 family)
MIDRRQTLAGAGAAAIAAQSSLARASTPSELFDQKLEEILTTQFNRNLERNPEFATALGLDKGKNAKLRFKLNDYSLAEAERLRRTASDNWADLQTVPRDNLSLGGVLSYDIAAFRLLLANDSDARFQYGWPGGRMAPYVVSQLTGAWYQVPDFLSSQHKIEVKDDAEAYLSRLHAFPMALDQQTEYLRRDAGLGVVPPDFIIALTLAGIRKLRGEPAERSVLVRTLVDKAKAKGLGDYEAQAEQAFNGPIAQALDRQIAALEALKPSAVHDAGVWRLPQGLTYYESALLASTTYKLTGEQVHQIGLKQVAELQAQMDELLKAQGLTEGTVGARIAHLNSDPKHLYPNTEEGRTELLAHLNALVADMQKRLPKAFDNLPKAALEIRRVPPYIEAGAPLGYYQGAPLDNSRPGAYYINLQDTANWPKWGLPTLTYHEGVPGHHFQISLSREQGTLPIYRRAGGGFSAYSEGWALYSEQLANDLGAYDDDPLGRIGMGQSLLFRACRLVVDSGIHAKKWTREQGIRYLVDNCGRTVGAATNEVERYAVWPGQACSYKIGQTVIQDWRIKAAQRLGSRFDLKGFHDAVLLKGAMPLTLLQAEVDRWVKRQG